MKNRFASSFAFLALSLGAVGLASADNYKLDNVHSSVNYKISHLGVSSSYGRFDSPEGTLTTDDDASKMTFNLTIATDKIDSSNTKRDAHLKSPDFFDAKQFPEITFKSTSVKKTGDGSYEVTGDLTLHGVTKSIVIPLTKVGEIDTPAPMNDHRIGYDATVSLKRSDYGMGKMVPMIGDDVTLMIAIEAIRQ